MSGLKLDNATRGSLNTCTSYPPCSNPFPKVKVISGSSSTINIFLGDKPPRYYYSTISPFSFLPDNELNKHSSRCFDCIKSIMIDDVPSLVGGSLIRLTSYPWLN